jgi:hypothetical protein
VGLLEIGAGLEALPIDIEDVRCDIGINEIGKIVR